MAVEQRQLPAARRVPEPCRAVVRGGHHSGPIRAERRRADPPLVPLQDHQLRAAGRVPEPRRVIIRAGHDPGPVRAEGCRPDRALVPSQHRELPAAGGIPDPRRVIIRAGHDPDPVRAEGCRSDRALVPLQHRELPAAGGVPDPRRAILRGGHQARPVRAERRPPERDALGAFQHRQLPPRGRLPEARRTIIGCGQKPRPARAEGRRKDALALDRQHRQLTLLQDRLIESGLRLGGIGSIGLAQVLGQGFESQQNPLGCVAAPGLLQGHLREEPRLRLEDLIALRIRSLLFVLGGVRLNEGFLFGHVGLVSKALLLPGEFDLLMRVESEPAGDQQQAADRGRDAGAPEPPPASVLAFGRVGKRDLERGQVVAGALAEVAQQVEVGRAPERARGPPALVPVGGRIVQLPVEPEVAAAGVEPLLQQPPMIEQCLVGDLRGGRLPGAGERDQAAAGLGKTAQQGEHARLGVAAGHDLGERGPAPGVLGAFAQAHHGQERPPGDRPLLLAQAVVDRLRLIGQSAPDAPQCPDRLSRRRAVLETIPDPGQHELEQRQGALAATGLLDQQIDGARIDLAAGAPRRLLDRPPQPGLVHDRHHHVLARDQAAQLRVLIDRPQKIAAQGEDDRDPAARLARGVQEVADERRALGLVVA